MNFLEQENLLDDINTQIEKSKQNLKVLKGGEKGKSNIKLRNHVQSLINYLENSKDKGNNTRHIAFQIDKIKNIYLNI